MRSLLIAVTFWLSLLGSGVYSAATLYSRAFKEPGFDCDNVFFPASRLESVVRWARISSTLRANGSKKQGQSLSTYYGPPFTRSYFITPIYPAPGSFKEGAITPYRVVFNERFEVFSVIIKKSDGVRECKMRERAYPVNTPYSFYCNKMHFPYESLVAVVKEVCPKIGKITQPGYPARFDGFPFATYANQRYIYPIFLERAYVQGEDPGEYRVVMNNNCKFLGVIGYDSTGTYLCSQMGKPVKMDNNNLRIDSGKKIP